MICPMRKQTTRICRKHHLAWMLASLLCGLLPVTLIAADDNRYAFENDSLRVRMTVRTAQQIAAFYEGRGFRKDMINASREACFITVGVGNKSTDILWLDLTQWSFQTEDGELQRIHRDVWKQRWQDMQIPLNMQSIFRWTLLPEYLDTRPGEHEAGNITLPRSNKPIRLRAVFQRGADKQLQPLIVTIDKINCDIQ